MREYQYTDYAINNANSEAIVYRFANGTVREITVDDFGGDEVAFNTWKSFSDNDYHNQEKQTRRTSRKDISYDSLEEMDLGYSEDCLEVMIKTEEEIALSEGVECPDWGGKYHGLILRLCGIIHCIKCLSENVSPESREVDMKTLGQAIDIADFYKQQSRYAYSLMDGDGRTAAAEYVLKKLRDKTPANLTETEIKGRDDRPFC